jgi:hypothetical protein
MRLFLSCFLLLSVSNVFSQESETSKDVPKVKIDSLYREDQFYFGFTYNSLQQKPAGLAQDKLSTGFSIGFLRDMPVNEKRTMAIAPGLGLSYTNFNQNLAISLANGEPVYQVIDPNRTFDKNKFSQLFVDLPIELRWRTSTYESHKFWRIYGGFKLSYLLYDKSVFSDAQGKVIITGNKDFNKVLYGVYISAGFNSVNVYGYYGLKSLFKSAKSNGEAIAMRSLNIGVVFYIL